jgi:hypothetical protein
MPNRPHALCDCDEICNGCYRCYRSTGETVCDWNCPHTADEHADDIEELAHDEQRRQAGFYSHGTITRESHPELFAVLDGCGSAHGPECDCYDCRVERAADEAQEPRR